MNRTEVLNLPTVLARTIANVHAIEQKVIRILILVHLISNRPQISHRLNTVTTGRSCCACDG